MRCINRDVAELIFAIIKLLVFIVGILILFIGETYLIVPDGAFGHQFTDFMILFNLSVLVYGVFNMHHVFNYIFPKC